MKTEIQHLCGKEIRVDCCNTVVVGSGAAGFNTADKLHALGQTDIVLVTEAVKAGTSRNTGSDKQTYYKLTLSGGDPDSVREMAQTLFDGKCVDGEIALCEAALSAQGFLRLCELGVPFPRNRYGEYIGYKTDHDPRRRATSIGPYTSRRMTEALEASVHAKGITVCDHCQVVKIVTGNGEVKGLICLDETGGYRIFRCKNVVYATGGPAGIYADSVYPFGHYGASGIAFEAGVEGRNLTEWQFGLASIKPRWNVSGTYMQVLPKFISTDKDGNDPREFLPEFFGDPGEMLSMVFLKGYQWPFDVRKVKNGSSIIDILVYMESCKGRRVFLDFRENPKNEPVDFSALSEEARAYLERAGAVFGTPIARLLHMNAPAVDFYMDKGVDLRREPLEIALCAQHNNGGLAVDAWWQTNIKGFFAAGEAAGSHGVYRPGGSALNAGQVGSARAATFIAANRQGTPPDFDFRPEIEKLLELETALLAQEDNLEALTRNYTAEMSRCAGAIRDLDELVQLKTKVEALLAQFPRHVKISRREKLKRALRFRDILICQLVYLSSMEDYAEQGGKSRGSALYTDKTGEKPYEKLPDVFTFALSEENGKMQEVLYENGTCSFRWRTPHPIPADDDFFENVWRSYRENGNIY